MVENYGSDLLNTCEKAARNNLALTDGQKTKCVNCIVDYGISLFGLNPLPAQYQLLAIAAIDLIPGLKSKFGKPTVSVLCSIYINIIIVFISSMYIETPSVI